MVTTSTNHRRVIKILAADIADNVEKPTEPLQSIEAKRSPEGPLKGTPYSYMDCKQHPDNRFV